MNQFLASLVLLFNWILFTFAEEAENYDDVPSQVDINDIPSDIPMTSSVLGMSTTSVDKDNKLKDGVESVLHFVRHHVLYCAIGAGIVLLCCIACCCCCRHKRKQRQNQNPQYSYYTQV